MSSPQTEHLLSHKFFGDFHSIVHFVRGKQKMAQVDLSPANPDFNEGIYKSSEAFQQFIDSEMAKNNADYLFGGYAETRNMYLRSNLFDDNLRNKTGGSEEPRNLHLGMDIWGPAGTPVFAPLGGMVHSMANNNNFGDYGPTIILQHQIDMFNFYTLYGHLSVADLKKLRVGQFITRGETLAHFGEENENGNWPPHLHFQVIIEINEWEGNYPGVCKQSEAGKYLANSPDPDLILKMNRFTKD